MVCKELIFCCIAWMTTGCTCSLACNAPVGTSIHVIFTFPSRVKKNKNPLIQTLCAWACSPLPTCTIPDRTDLYQAALVNMPWGMKLANILYPSCAGYSHVVCPCINIFTLNWIDGDQTSLIWMRSEWHLKMEYPKSWRWEIEGGRFLIN